MTWDLMWEGEAEGEEEMTTALQLRPSMKSVP